MARYLLIKLLYCFVFCCYLGVSQDEIITTSEGDPPAQALPEPQTDTATIDVKDIPVEQSGIPITGLGPAVPIDGPITLSDEPVAPPPLPIKQDEIITTSEGDPPVQALPEPQTVYDTVTIDVKDIPVQEPGIPITGLGPEVPVDGPITIAGGPAAPRPSPRKPGPLNCGPNEKATCVPMCPPERTCRNRNKRYRCKKRPCLTYRCACKPGYFRNSIGQCISRAQCNQCSKPHEYYACGGACDNVCSTIKFQNQTDCPIFNIQCNKMCYCDAGYARDKNGNCIPIKKCPPSCSDPNEEYVLTKSCPPDLCVSLVARYNCDPNEKAKKRCRCKSGYFRISPGSPCVPLCSCPQVANTPECLNGLN